MLTFGSKNVKIIKRFENRYKKVSNIKKDVRIKIHSELYDVDASLFSDEEVDLNNVPISEETPEPDIFDMNSIGFYTDDGERISISYNESEATGMEGSTTTIYFLCAVATNCSTSSFFPISW